MPMRTALLGCVLVVFAGCGTDNTSGNAGASDSQASASDAADRAKTDAASGDSASETAGSSKGFACPTATEPACGGELEGTTWTVVEFCAEDPTAAAALFQHPYDNLPACKPPGGTVAGKLTHTGSLHFENGEIQIQLTTQALTTYTFSDACLMAAKPEAAAPSPACASLNKADVMTCTYAAGSAGTCTCQAVVPGDSSQGSEPYTTVAGHTLMIGGEMQANYCVQGDRLLLDITPHLKSWRWWLLKRTY